MTATKTTAPTIPGTPNSNRGFDAQFLGSVPRCSPLLLDGIAVSIDAVRMKFIFATSCYDFERHERTDTLVRVLYALTDLNLWNERLFEIESLPERNFKCGVYRNTVRFSHPDGWSFVVLVGRYCTSSSAGGSGFNTARQIAAEAVMDFNPNKVPRRAWERVAGILRSWAVTLPTVQRFDLALDFPIDRGSLTLQQRPGSGYEKFVDPRGATTEYTGERSHHAAVKLYDKAAELEIDTNCTRLEITVEPKKYKGIADLMPTILSISPLSLNVDFSVLPFQVQAVLIHPDLYPVLKASVGRNTWAKYDKLIRQYSQDNGDTVLALSTDQQTQVDRYLRSYLARLISGTEGGAA